MTSNSEKLRCSNCGKIIAKGREKELSGKFYGTRCYQMARGEIPNSIKKALLTVGQESIFEKDFTQKR